MGRSSRQDPLKAFRYRIEVPGFKRVGFKFCSGLHESTEITGYREGGFNESERKSPGLTTYDNVTLRRGQLEDSVGSSGGFDMYMWRLQVASVKTEGYNDFDFRREPNIVQVGRDGSDAYVWNLQEAWPAEYKAFGDLDGSSNDNLLEEIVLANEGWEMQDGPQPPGPGETLSSSLGG